LVPQAFNAAAFPNPFNSSSTLRFTLPSAGQVKVAYYNILGKKIFSFEKEYSSSGVKEFTWNGKDDTGNDVCSGIYFCTVSAEKNSKTIKMVLMK